MRYKSPTVPGLAARLEHRSILGDVAKTLRIAFRLSALEPLLVAALALTLLASCIGSAPQNAKADENLTEAEVEYVENSHSACVKVLDDFARLTESQIVEIKYYQRGANEFVEDDFS